MDIERCKRYRLPVMVYVARDYPSCPKIELQYFLYFYGINLEREIHDIKLPGLAQIPGAYPV